MKLIKSKAELVLQQEGLEGVYKQIEFCGRTCYRSLDKITEDSAKAFVEKMVASKHTAMLEHGTVYLTVPMYDANVDFAYQRYFYNKYSKVKDYVEKEVWATIDKDCYYITTNLRVIYENGWLDDLQYICSPTEHHEKRYTMKFITDRGVSHELVRHRVFSFAQESQRYCNYSKDKFGGEITFIIPNWLKNSITNNDTFNYDEHITKWQSSEDSKTSNFLQSIAFSEKNYLTLLQNGCTPQEARAVLPNATKTEVLMTGFASDWRFFFDLRYYGETGKPHPDMELLAGKAREEFIKAGIWEDIMSTPSKFAQIKKTHQETKNFADNLSKLLNV